MWLGGVSLLFDPQFYLGPPASGAPAHFHSPAINVMAYGKKRWALFPPHRSSFYSIKPSVDFFKYDVPELDAIGEVRKHADQWNILSVFVAVCQLRVEGMCGYRTLNVRRRNVVCATERLLGLGCAALQHSVTHSFAWSTLFSLQVLHVTQNTGDVLCVPKGWGHATLNIETSIGFAFEFAHFLTVSWVRVLVWYTRC